MKQESRVSKNDRAYLRELAKKYLDYANLPVMEERTRAWYDHNSLKGLKPMVVMEMATFESDILSGLKCGSEFSKAIEKELLRHILNYELINDDKVISPYFTINWDIREQGMDIQKELGEDSSGRKLGYRPVHPIKDLKEDFHLLKPSVFSVDREHTLEQKALLEEIFGDILPVKIKNSSLHWHFAPTARIIDLMGMETMLYSMVDYPDEMHQLMRFLTDNLFAFVKWQEKEGLLVLNNENDYTGAGSYGFTTELPSSGYHENGPVTPKDLWVNMNSQESVGISPDMFGEFISPYYHDLAGEFGSVYYGCCEPVHDIWQDYISKLLGLRKVSISAWCNETLMGEALRGSNVIYSRKPSPNFVGVGEKLDEEAFGKYIENTLTAAKGCHVEFIFRDIYSLGGDITKPGRAVKITRELIEKYY